MEVCCHEADNKTGWFCKVNRNVISWTCRRGAHFGVRNICLRGSWMISKCLTSSRLLLPEVTTCVLRCVAEWEWSDFRHCGHNGKRFFLWGAVDFSHHLYVQTGSRICPESCPGILHLRIKHVNHEAALCYAEILDVLQCTSRRHCVVLTRRTSVGLPLLSNKSLILLSCTTDSLGWLRGKSEMIICWWAASCSRKYSSFFFSRSFVQSAERYPFHVVVSFIFVQKSVDMSISSDVIASRNLTIFFCMVQFLIFVVGLLKVSIFSDVI